MIIKKFQGKTEAEATENAKKELGNGVVIMNVKTLKKKGLFAFLKPQVVEVTVALEDEAEHLSTPKRETPYTGIPPVSNGPVNVAPAAPAEAEKDGKSVEVLEEKIDSLQNLLVAQLQKKEESEEDKQPEPKKEETPGKDENIVRFMKLLYNIMLENEIDEKYINQIMDEIEKIHKPGMPFDYALANTYQKMILKFGKPSGITPASSGPKVVFYVGPTGVGKTTTIAKIASKFSVEDKKKVALLTADTYRIAAAEQLRTYADILEVPFRVIYTAEEFTKACTESFSD